MALHPNFDTIVVRVHFGAKGCRKVHFVLVIEVKYKLMQILQ